MPGCPSSPPPQSTGTVATAHTRHRMPQQAAFINPLYPSPQRQAFRLLQTKQPDRLPPTTMATAASAAAIVDLSAAFIAVEIFISFLDPQLGASPPSPQAAQFDSAVGELLLPLAALCLLASASTAIYRHLQHSAAAAGAAGRRRLCRLFAILCASVGTLEFFFFVYPAGVGGGDVGAQARALGLAAARVLPAAAAATFFMGMALIIIAHIGAGGEGGGGGAFAADAVSFLTKTAFGAAAALICLTALALYGIY